MAIKRKKWKWIDTFFCFILGNLFLFARRERKAQGWGLDWGMRNWKWNAHSDQACCTTTGRTCGCLCCSLFLTHFLVKVLSFTTYIYTMDCRQCKHTHIYTLTSNKTCAKLLSVTIFLDKWVNESMAMSTPPRAASRSILVLQLASSNRLFHCYTIGSLICGFRYAAVLRHDQS